MCYETSSAIRSKTCLRSPLSEGSGTCCESKNVVETVEGDVTRSVPIGINLRDKNPIIPKDFPAPNMPASYEISYFDAAGRAEAIRVMLHAAGVEFKDNRFKGPEWPKIKPTTPLGAVPTLKIDDDTYCQSLALARYAAKLAGFYPADPLEALVVDEVMDTCVDLITSCPQDTDVEEKKRKRLEWQEGPLTKSANLVERRIQASGGASVAKAPSVADIILKGTVEGIKGGFFDYIDTNFFDTYPGILATCDAIAKDPKVKAYYDSLE